MIRTLAQLLELGGEHSSRTSLVCGRQPRGPFVGLNRDEVVLMAACGFESLAARG